MCLHVDEQCKFSLRSLSGRTRVGASDAAEQKGAQFLGEVCEYSRALKGLSKLKKVQLILYSVA